MRYETNFIPILIIEKIEHSDAGKYICAVANDEGQSQFEIEIIIFGWHLEEYFKNLNLNKVFEIQFILSLINLIL